MTDKLKPCRWCRRNLCHRLWRAYHWVGCPMTLQDNIAKAFMDHVQSHVDSGKPWNGTKAAEAAIAIIRASVPELVWGEWHGYRLHTWNNLAALAEANSAYGRYSIGRLHRYLPSTNKKVRPFDREYSNEWWVEAPFNKGALLGPFGHDVEAKAAAQAHNVAQLMKGLGI